MTTISPESDEGPDGPPGRESAHGWGILPARPPREIVDLERGRGAEALDRSRAASATSLPRGLGRSYGDVCTNPGGVVLRTRRLDRVLEMDPERGVLRCEPGVTLEQALAHAVPAGWFLPVVPGTRFITVAGAVANDVHGKNHHRAGSFGNGVRRLVVLRSDGERIVCGPAENEPFFRATVGGMGLTGLIEEIEVQLSPWPTSMVEEQIRPFRSFEEYLALDRELADSHEHLSAWVSGTGSGARGLVFAGRSADAGRPAEAGKNSAEARNAAHARNPSEGGSSPEPASRTSAPSRRSGPLPLPSRTVREPRRGYPWGPLALNRLSIRLFNHAYRWAKGARSRRVCHYESAFFPLDGVPEWNRLYGRPGFFQYQFVVPEGDFAVVGTGILDTCRRRGEPPFLVVAKRFGTMKPVGMLSFGRPGVTLAMDFPNRGGSTLELFHELDRRVRDAGGALYPAKDARMPPAMFRHSFPRWRDFLPHRDPAISSGFARRVFQENA